jgi:hypothetical protein
VFVRAHSNIEETGEIINISIDGLAFRHIKDRALESDIHRVDILSSDHLEQVADIPVRIINEFDEINENPIFLLPMRRCGVQFIELTTSQKQKLNDLLNKNTKNRHSPRS